jgi:hypothetical protein
MLLHSLTFVLSLHPFFYGKTKGKRQISESYQRQKNAASFLLRFVCCPSVLPGDQKRGRKMTVHTTKKEKIKSEELKTRRR